MKKILILSSVILSLLITSLSFAAWDATRPTDDEYKYLVPGVIRANWDAIVLGTDPVLQITNAKIATAADIVDTKLRQITTANKVSGTSLFGFANIPYTAGVIPAANLPVDNLKLTGDQTITSGVKTYVISPVVPTPTTDYQVSTKKYVDDIAVALIGNQTVAGIKTFSSFPLTPSSAPTTNYQMANKKYVDDATIAVPDASVTTAKLKTASGEVSSVGGDLTLPGGEYGFYPQIKQTPGYGGQVYFCYGCQATNYTANISVYSAGAAYYFRQRYVTASGVDLWIFILLDKTTKKIISAYQAPDHPAYGNGGDFDKVAHPFGNYDSTKYDLILVDKESCTLIKEESKKTDKSILTLINEDYKPDLSREEKYVPLHSGKFINDDTQIHTKVMVNTIPNYIKVRRLIKNNN
jgi:hypothetical protein